MIAEAPYLRAAQPITDTAGRVQVVIDFTDGAADEFIAELPPPNNARSDGIQEKKFFHRPKVLKLVEHYEKTYGFTRTGMTSWVGSSVTGFLSVDQINRIQADGAVRLISDNARSKFSSAPPWYDFNPGTATFSWGSVAVVPHPKIAGTSRRVYVIDGGVADHTNLSSVSARKNVGCGATYPGTAMTGDCASISFPEYNYPPVDCFGHATHVAGIVAGSGVFGATYGVYSGVNVISVGLLNAHQEYVYGPSSPQGLTSPLGNSAGWCATTPPAFDTIGYGLDFTYWDTAYNSGGAVTIANISINPGQMGWRYYPNTDSWQSEANYSKVRALAAPGVFQNSSGGYSAYPGVFVAQSAGNLQTNACGVGNGSTGSLAYMPPVGYLPGGPPPNWAADAYDGIMVVGALDSSGQAASTYSNSYPPGIQDGGSNYGPCIDIWAPGNSIVSAWGNHALWTRTMADFGGTSEPNTRVGQTYSGVVGSGSSGWMYLSGTSMAAPHVAGVAAYLADAYSLTTPAAIEAKIRSLSQAFNGTVDAAGYPIRVLQSQ